MKPILGDLTVSMSDFKSSPVAVLKWSRNRPVAVLNHNQQVAFYAVEPVLWKAVLEELADHDLHQKVLARIREVSRAVEVDVDEDW